MVKKKLILSIKSFKEIERKYKKVQITFILI